MTVDDDPWFVDKEPFLFDVTPAAMIVPMNGSLEVTVKPAEKKMMQQHFMIEVNSYLFEIQEPRASKGCISQLYGVFNAGEEVKFNIRLRDKENSAPELNCNTTARGELFIQHFTVNAMISECWYWKFKESKVLLDCQNFDCTAAEFRIELRPEDSSNEEVKRRMDQFEKDKRLFQERRAAEELKEKEREMKMNDETCGETLGISLNEEENKKEVDKTDDKTQGTEDEKDKKKEVVEPPKAPEKEASKPSKSPVKPEKPSSKKEEPKKREKSEKKSEKKADEKKPDAAKSAVKSADSKDAKVEPKAESQYQNLDAQLPPELKTPVPAERKPQPMKKKKTNPCCTIL